MKNIKSSPTKFIAAAAVVILMAIAASRQLYLFVVFQNADGVLDAQSGRYHLWLAVGAILTASLAACLMFLFFLGRGKANGSEAVSSLLDPRPALPNLTPNVSSPTPEHIKAMSWAQQNEWCVRGQADDRRPLNGSAGVSLGSASAQRSVARLAHQVMYRKWAGERRD